MTTFRDLGLSEPVLASIAAMGFEEPTPVQAQTIPNLMQGHDVVAQALTGTGKTAAFGIPLVERLDMDRLVPQAIVLAPTRELAVQVAEQISGIGQARGLRLVPIYGGQPIDRQLRALRAGVHAIVATPGRLMDHMRRGTVDLSNVKMLVLDEADVMLDMGFQEDVEFVTSHLPADRVTALFSATMPVPIVELSRKYMREPEVIRLSKPRELTVPEIDQSYYTVPFQRKFEALCRVLDVKRSDRTLVFCSTKRMVDQLTEFLQGRGYRAEGLHGDMGQAAREKALRAFRAAQTEVLTATDVAARGLDIDDVNLVVNFDIPPDAEYYVHRIGRTGRLGRKGEAITFVNPWELRELKMIEQATGARLRRETVPTSVDVEQRETQLLRKKLEESLEAGRWSQYRELVEDMLEEHDATEVAAAALALFAHRTARSLKPADEATHVPGQFFGPEQEAERRQERRYRPGGRDDRGAASGPAGSRRPFFERSGPRDRGDRFGPRRDDRPSGGEPSGQGGFRRPFDQRPPRDRAADRTEGRPAPDASAGPRPDARPEPRQRWERGPRPVGRDRPFGGHPREHHD